MISTVRPVDNPFAGSRVEALPFIGGPPERSDLALRIDELGGRAAIVGPKGSGKTTLLEALAGGLQPPVALIRIRGDEPHPLRSAKSQLPDPLTGSHTILLDGAEQLGPLAWHRFLLASRAAGRLVATLHRPGRLPTLQACSTDPELLRTLVSRLAPNDTTNLGDLFRRHGGNIRDCLRELYDVYAGRQV